MLCVYWVGCCMCDMKRQKLSYKTSECLVQKASPCVQFDHYLYCYSIYSTVAADFVSRQRCTWSDGVASPSGRLMTTCGSAFCSMELRGRYQTNQYAKRKVPHQSVTEAAQFYKGGFCHYENTPIQIYWKFYHQKTENFQMKKTLILFIFLLKT